MKGKRLNLEGQTFGRLHVLGEAGRDRQRHVLWRCECLCGGEKVARGSDIKAGKVKSCGCLRERRKR